MERKTLPGFICKGDCKNCVVRDWRDLKKYYYEPVFSPVACSRAVSNGFSASVITEAEYNELVNYIDSDYQDNDDFDENYQCQMNSKCLNTKTCNGCSVMEYLISLGYTPSKRPFWNNTYRKFNLPNGKCKDCKCLMDELCGVTVYRSRLIEKYSEYDPDLIINEEFIDKITQQITDAANHLAKVQTEEIINENPQYQVEIKAQLDENIDEDDRTKNKIIKKSVENREYHEKLVTRLNALRARFRYPNTSDLDKTKDAIKATKPWNPPFIYTGDGQALANKAREKVLRRAILRKAPVLQDVEEGTEKYEKIASALDKMYQQKYLRKMRNAIYDIVYDEYYSTILDTPICCGRCAECDLIDIYKNHGHIHSKLVTYRDKCRQYAEECVDDICKKFDFFQVSEMVDAPDHGGLEYWNTQNLTENKILDFIGKKLVEEEAKMKTDIIK